MSLPADNAGQLPRDDPSNRPTPDDDVYWWRVITLLDGFVSQLEAFGWELNSNVGEPDPQTVLDMAQVLDDLQRKLVELDRWLNYQRQTWWITLQTGLNDARTRCWTEEIRVAFSQYRRTRTNDLIRSAAQGNREIERDRIIAGDGMIAFMDAIRLAIQVAQQQRDSAGR